MEKRILLEKIKELETELQEKENIIHDLEEKISLLELLHFGPKTEKWTDVDDRQALLFNEAEDEAFKQIDKEKQKSAVETIEVGPYKRRKKKKRNGGRKAISKDLPREIKTYDISEEEKLCACGCKKTCIGAETAERVKIKPIEVTVLQERKLKYACKNCEGTYADEPGVTTAKGKKHLIPGSIATSSFIAWSINEKYTFGLPLYRQEKRLEYIGVPIPRATLSNIIIRAAEECERIYEFLMEHVKSGSLINADETRVQVLREPGREAQKQSWMWVYYGGPQGQPGVVFHYDEKRSSEVPYEFLKDYSGWLQTDDYEAYQAALKKLNKSRSNKKKIKQILCWSHARSKFFKTWKITKSEHAKKAMDYIRDLFALEKLSEKCSEKVFYKQRKCKAGIIFMEFKTWLEKLYISTPPKSILGRAILYTLDNWEKLILYIEDPILTPSNNSAENAIRPFVVGRKAWLFSITPKGARASSILYSLIETAKLQKLNPYEYLHYIFEKLPYAETEQDYIDLLPFNLTAENISLKNEGGKN